MTSFKFIAFSSIALFFLACGGDADPAKFFDIQLEAGKKVFQVNQAVAVDIQNKKNLAIDKITYSIDGNELRYSGNKITLDIPKLGDKILKARVDYDGNSVEITEKIRVLADKVPEIYTYEIINEYPHDIEAFTQGLEFYNDTLYEGTGKNGNSWLRKVAYTTGGVIGQIDLEKSFFGEGITVFKEKIYQLTWHGKIGFVYDLKTFEKTGSFQYGNSKEGWGLCNDGEKLYKSDGTEKIWILNPETLVEEDYIQTVTNKSIFNKANELEYVNGKIYANVWQKESMMIIDAQSGAIEGVINFGGLKAHVKQHDKLDVLNGVAYHPGRKTFFVTGKYWDKLFEVNIKKKE
ncbi:MAG TPA: glutaminyl-peptide cyclotransferase [Eudoraea sp.]|nr:glutaminyl-peptide cyclotransferase [Eudoraea sp.]